MKKVFILILILLILLSYIGIFASAAENPLTYCPYYGNIYFYDYNNERYANLSVIWNEAGVSEFDSMLTIDS